MYKWVIAIKETEKYPVGSIFLYPVGKEVDDTAIIADGRSLKIADYYSIYKVIERKYSPPKYIETVVKWRDFTKHWKWYLIWKHRRRELWVLNPMFKQDEFNIPNLLEMLVYGSHGL